MPIAPVSGNPTFGLFSLYTIMIPVSRKTLNKMLRVFLVYQDIVLEKEAAATKLRGSAARHPTGFPRAYADGLPIGE